jgi:NlpC/P60 family/S-layer homology domain
VGLRISIVAAALALLPTGAALAATGSGSSWALPQIRLVTAAGLMGTKDPATFRPTAPLTMQALANLVFGLTQLLSPAAVPPEPTQTTTGATQTTTAAVTQTTADPAAATTAATTTTTVTATLPATPPNVPNGGGGATMATLDAQLVDGLGLSEAAVEFARGAQAAGLVVPPRFGAEVVARLLGLRINHPATDDSLELLPDDVATRAEAAYSAAQVLRFPGWQLPTVQTLADTFSLPALSPWQIRILDTAVARIGMPYVWGGTSDGPERDFGVAANGGYDCSGFVWRVYKLQSYPDEGTLASTLRGRTTYVMSGEVPRSDRIDFAHLEPADVLFFGAHGPRSSPAEVDHTAIYLGNGWLIQSSGQGVALAQLSGWYRTRFAWARRPLREAGLG